MIVTVLLYGVKSCKYSAPRCEVSLQGVRFDFIQDSGLNILDYEMNGGVLQELFGLDWKFMNNWPHYKIEIIKLAQRGQKEFYFVKIVPKLGEKWGNLGFTG